MAEIFSRGLELAEVSDVLARLLPDVPQEAIAELAPDARLVAVREGSTLVRRGERHNVGVVESGLLSLSIRSSDGRSGTITYFKPGDPYGLISLYQPMPGTVVAQQPTTVVRLRAQRLLHLTREQLAISEYINATMARYAFDMAAAAEEFAFRSVAERVVKHLLVLAHVEPGSSGKRGARITQQQLADAAGTAREVVARTLHELSGEGVITMSRGHVTINDEAVLRRWLD